MFELKRDGNRGVCRVVIKLSQDTVLSLSTNTEAHCTKTQNTVLKTVSWDDYRQLGLYGLYLLTMDGLVDHRITGYYPVAPVM